MNQEGYSHPGHPGSGSFREYYREVSYGQFSPYSHVVDWVTAPNNHDYYAYSNPNGYQHVLQLVRAVVDSAEAHGLDWSVYDNDGDGYVDALNIIHAGPGAEEGDHSNIWSHKWSLSVAGLAVQYDGVWIDSYTMNPEIQNNGIVAIGVICHEFGHALGLPDLYDTDYSSTGAGQLALMGTGAWGTSGNTPWYPSSPNAWSKSRLGWVEVQPLTTDVTELAVEQIHSRNLVYRIDHPNDGSEYWLIENRQAVGTDILMPMPGLLIWHIDTEKTEGGGGVNNDEPHYGVGLEQADGLFNLENGMGSDGGDPYPGTTNNREFSHNSTPNSDSYYGIPSMISITNISDPDSIMTFDLTFEPYLIATIGFNNGAGAAYDTGSVAITLSNTMPLAALEFQITGIPAVLTVTGVEPSTRVTVDSIQITDNTITLVNPIITPGTGSILSVALFANTGISHTVTLTFDDLFATDTAQNEIGFITDSGIYQVQAVAQTITIGDSSGNIGHGGSYTVSLRNTVPLKMIMFGLQDTPDRLITTDELYTDVNQNGTWDPGEPLQDWNGDSVWTPAIQLAERLENWNFQLSYTDYGIQFTASSWNNPITVGDGPVLIINNLIDPTATPGEVTITVPVATLMDQYGNVGVPYTADPGIFTILPELALGESQPLPGEFSLSPNYPNPFNAVTTISYQVPRTARVAFTIYDLSGKIVYQNRPEGLLPPGRYTFRWNGTDGSGQPVASGIYFLQMRSGDFHQVRKLLLVK
jgi:M6 family metalloprotease-like protein